MFFELEVLRRGQKLHLVWKSATMGINKLKRKDVASVNVCQACNYILKFIVTESLRPRDRFSLVLSSKLINGLARILDRQADILLKDIWAFLAIVRKPIVFEVIEDISDVFAVPKPTKRPRTKRKAPAVTEEVEAEPGVQPVTDISLKTLREPTELPQKSIIEELMDLGTGEEPELATTQRAANVTTAEVEVLPQQKRATTDIDFVNVAKVPKKTAASGIEEARKEANLQIAEVSEIIPAEKTIEHPKEPEPQPATKVPEAAKETCIKPKTKKLPDRNMLLLVRKPKKKLHTVESKNMCESTPHVKVVPGESFLNWIRNSNIDFNDLYEKFSNAAEEIEAQRAGEFSKDNVSHMSSLKLPSSSTSNAGSAVHTSLKKISNLPEITPLSPVAEPQTLFADVHESLLDRTTNGHVDQSYVSQSLMEENDKSRRDSLRSIVTKIMDFEEKNNVHATLEDIAQRPFTQRIIARLFNDLLRLVQLLYVKLVNKENSLELDHIVLGPKTLQ